MYILPIANENQKAYNITIKRGTPQESEQATGREGKKMDTTRFFEVILATLKKEYGQDFEAMSLDEKMGLVMIFADQITKDEPEIMQGLASAVYTELTI